MDNVRKHNIHIVIYCIGVRIRRNGDEISANKQQTRHERVVLCSETQGHFTGFVKSKPLVGREYECLFRGIYERWGFPSVKSN
jgi:hypothetical protein